MLIIDVSKNQGKIDWGKVLPHVGGVMLKIGYRGYAQPGNIDYAEKFEENFAAIKGKLPLGFYFYSTAINTAEATEEADWVINKLKGVEVKLPISYDYEYITNDKKYRTAGQTKKQRSDCAIAFLNRIKAAGYTPMMYASSSGLKSNWDTKRIKDETGCMIWEAHYGNNTGDMSKTTKPNSGYTWDIWQFTAKGRIDGINANVDINYTERDFAIIPESRPKEIPKDAPGTYKVKAGDTLYPISKKYGVTVDSIVLANKLKYPNITADLINVGWVLDIPKTNVMSGTVVSAIGLKVRSTPNGTKLGLLAPGTRVKILSQSGGWGKIIWNGKYGYISMKYVKV